MSFFERFLGLGGIGSPWFQYLTEAEGSARWNEMICLVGL